jgi:deoxyribodipyrimidine photo-lyase
MRALMWFRSDLRLQDNTALHHACKAADEGVMAVFAICPKQWADHHWGSMKVHFVLRSVRALSESLAKLNIPLRIIRADCFDEVPSKLLNLAKRHACEALYFNKEYEVNELRRDREVATLFQEHRKIIHAFTDQVIVDVGCLRTGTGGWYTVFTPFKRKWCEALKEEGPPPAWPRPRRQQDLGVKPDAVPTKLRGFSGPRRPDLCPEGEQAAHKRLRMFASKRIGDYHRLRDYPAVDGTSTLSPYLAAGVLSPRQCLHAALNANNGRLDSGKKGVTTWISELAWREFYRHVLIGFPRVCMGRPFKPETDGLPWHYDDERFATWCAGRTGYPIVDAAMRQLNQTGWMHNRLRMITAMFLTKHLLIDWRWGERYFMRRLVDGDLASNNGGWQWSASTGTDAAPYFRIFNPSSQSRRFDPQGGFVRQFLPELRDMPTALLHDPSTLARNLPSGIDYPPPICDHAFARRRAIETFERVLKRPGR